MHFGTERMHSAICIPRYVYGRGVFFSLVSVWVWWWGDKDRFLAYIMGWIECFAGLSWLRNVELKEVIGISPWTMCVIWALWVNFMFFANLFCNIFLVVYDLCAEIYSVCVHVLILTPLLYYMCFTMQTTKFSKDCNLFIRRDHLSNFFMYGMKDLWHLMTKC